MLLRTAQPHPKCAGMGKTPTAHAPLPCLRALHRTPQRAAQNVLQNQGVRCGRPTARCAPAAEQCQVCEQWLAQHRQQQGCCYGKGAVRRLVDKGTGCHRFDEAQTEALKTPAMWDREGRERATT